MATPLWPEISHAFVLFMIVGFMAGVVHVLAPDHWLPASMVAWQRGWSLRRSALFGLACFAAHVTMGALVYFIFRTPLTRLQSGRLFGFTLIMVFGVMVFRLIRFSKIRDLFAKGPRGVWAFLSVFSLLGPCESLIPILIKAHHLGIGYLAPILAFLFGTLISGAALVVMGRLLWNRPFWLPLSVRLTYRGMGLLPVFALLAVGLSAILRLA